MLSDDLLAGAGAAAAYSGLTRRAVYYLSGCGDMPSVKRRGRLFFRKSALERYFSSDHCDERQRRIAARHCEPWLPFLEEFQP